MGSCEKDGRPSEAGASRPLETQQGGLGSKCSDLGRRAKNRTPFAKSHRTLASSSRQKKPRRS